MPMQTLPRFPLRVLRLGVPRDPRASTPPGARIRGQIALPAALALRAQSNPHSTTIVVTLVATCLSGVSAYLFAHALRRSLALSLSRPMSLAALRATVGISTRTVVFNRQDTKWTLLSLLFFIPSDRSVLQSWSTLFTPIHIVLFTPLAGTELDFMSDVLIQYSQNLFSQVAMNTAESGLASAQSVVGYPAVLNFNYRRVELFCLSSLKPVLTRDRNRTYNVSTGGILPAYLEPVRSTAGRLGNETLPAVTHSVTSLQHAFATNYSMVQQGLTADVSCSIVPLNALPMSLNITAVPLSNVAGNMLYYSCGVDDWSILRLYAGTWQMTDGNNSTLIGLSCDNPGDAYSERVAKSSRASETEHILKASGSWEAACTLGVSCTVTPQITTVHTDYTSAGNINTTILEATNSTDRAGPAGMFAFSTIMDMFFVSQGISADTIGNHTSSVMRALPSTQWTDTGLFEQIFLLRTCISETITPFADGAPPNMTRTTAGVYRTETLGWSFTSTPTHVILLPTTLIALASIAVIAFAWIQNPGQMGRRMDFDATNTLHLMAAAAADGRYLQGARVARDPRWGENRSRAGTSSRERVTIPSYGATRRRRQRLHTIGDRMCRDNGTARRSDRAKRARYDFEGHFCQDNRTYSRVEVYGDFRRGDQRQRFERLGKAGRRFKFVGLIKALISSVCLQDVYGAGKGPYARALVVTGADRSLVASPAAWNQPRTASLARQVPECVQTETKCAH
ncbi:hypothetical protein B0H11DRAFT_1928198 [Mycena galericulata]|nr:hypothetical protein B0H11DRAFT_1928198 [Mycena galericulata]